MAKAKLEQPVAKTKTESDSGKANKKGKVFSDLVIKEIMIQKNVTKEEAEKILEKHK